MGGFWPVFRLFLLMGLCSTAWAGGNPDDLLPETTHVPEPLLVQDNDTGESRITFSEEPDWIYQASDWVLNLYITQKGTRSQGSHGNLFFEGDAVKGELGEVRALPIGRVQYNGPAESRTHLWDNTGWQMVDPLVKPIVNEPVVPVPGSGKDPETELEALERDLPLEN